VADDEQVIALDPLGEAPLGLARDLGRLVGGRRQLLTAEHVSLCLVPERCAGRGGGVVARDAPAGVHTD